MPKGKGKAEGRRRLKKAARALRVAGQKKVRDRRWGRAVEDEDLDAGGPRDHKMRRAVEDRPSSAAERLAEAGEHGTSADAPEALGRGIVVGVRRRACQVFLGGRQIECRIPTEMAVFQQTSLAVGDDVQVARRGSDAMVTGVAPRKSKLSRPDPRIPGVERVLAANVEVAVIVASVRDPAFNTRLIDRYLVAVQAGGAEPVLCVNKLDLVDAWPEDLAIYRDADVRIIGTSCRDGRGVQDLTQAIQAKLCVFVGHSGVGKSSLLNQIEPELKILTRPVRERDGRGRHVTTFSTLHQLANGCRVIDTPGVRGLGLWRMKREHLRLYFPEFEALPPCRFRDCSHTHEPDCAVRSAVEAGAVSVSRYESYARILATMPES